MTGRVNIRKILQDPDLRRELFVSVIIATQAREGIATTRQQAERAYDKVQGEKDAVSILRHPESGDSLIGGAVMYTYSYHNGKFQLTDDSKVVEVFDEIGIVYDRGCSNTCLLLKHGNAARGQRWLDHLRSNLHRCGIAESLVCDKLKLLRTTCNVTVALNFLMVHSAYPYDKAEKMLQFEAVSAGGNG